MAYIRCTSCNESNPVTSEYQTFCQECNAKLEPNYQSWLLQNPGKTFQEFVQYCERRNTGGHSDVTAHQARTGTHSGAIIYRRQEPMAIAGFVLGLVSIVLVGFITGILAIIFSSLGLQKIKKTRSCLQGEAWQLPDWYWASLTWPFPWSPSCLPFRFCKAFPCFSGNRLAAAKPFRILPVYLLPAMLMNTQMNHGFQ